MAHAAHSAQANCLIIVCTLDTWHWGSEALWWPLPNTLCRLMYTHRHAYYYYLQLNSLYKDHSLLEIHSIITLSHGMPHQARHKTIPKVINLIGQTHLHIFVIFPLYLLSFDLKEWWKCVNYSSYVSLEEGWCECPSYGVLGVRAGATIQAAVQGDTFTGGTYSWMFH